MHDLNFLTVVKVMSLYVVSYKQLATCFSTFKVYEGSMDKLSGMCNLFVYSKHSLYNRLVCLFVCSFLIITFIDFHWLQHILFFALFKIPVRQ